MDEKFIVNQVYAFVFSVVAGAAWIAMYDLLKIIRHMFACNRVVTAVSDLLFWLIGTAFVIFIALLLNDGYIRSYLFIGIFFGAILYVLTIGNILKRIGRFIYVKSEPIRRRAKSVWQKYSAKKAAKRAVKLEAKQTKKCEDQCDEKGVKKNGGKKLCKKTCKTAEKKSKNKIKKKVSKKTRKRMDNR